ncbi:probable galacturonosyltransferase 4 isoform X2 [Ananas comosus]|nr:probable galacturonosyltransferase 4 isoform X2 [Ananas comosus]
MLLDLEAFGMAKEPMEIAHTDSLSDSDQLEVELAALPTNEKQRKSPAEHHCRVLLAIDEGFRSEKDGIVNQLTNQEIGNNGLEKPKERQEKIDVSAVNPKDASVLVKQGNNSEIRTENHIIASPSKLSRGPIIFHDAMIHRLKDQLTKAKASLSLQSTLSDSNFTKELCTQIRDVQRALGDATKDSDLPKNAEDKLKALEESLTKSKQIQDDCPAVVRKLDAKYQPVRNKLRDDKRFASVLTQNVAKSLPREIHCLALRLTAQYYASSSSQQQFPNVEKLEDPKLYHYVLISDNVLAAGVVVKSAVYFANEPENHVFHILTDEIHYAAMSMWFLANPPGEAAIEVRYMEEFSWINSSYSPAMKQLESDSLIDFYFKTRNVLPDGNLKYRNPKYLSMLNHLRFYIPEIFPKLNKVIFLDDDIVVQQDLTGLWSIDLKGMVNGAVETCRDDFHRFSQYLNFSNPLIVKTDVDPQSCGWAFGMNIFDLVEWRKKNITDIYHYWQNLNDNRSLWQLGTLPVGLLAFWKQTMPISKTWHVLGLGYNREISHDDIKQAAVIHFNGNSKPWLETAIPHFRRYWTRFVDYDQVYLRDCKMKSF